MDGFIGQVMMFGGSFAPRDWAFCDGQLLSISDYTALFSILGTTYGGDGRTTFALPDLRGRVPIHQGQGPGLTNRTLGSRAGVEQVTLTTGQLPSHNPTFGCVDSLGDAPSPVAHVPAAGGAPPVDLYQSAAPDATMNPAMMQNAGNNQGHDNIMPYLPIRYIICLNGLFPSRN